MLNFKTEQTLNSGLKHKLYNILSVKQLITSLNDYFSYVRKTALKFIVFSASLLIIQNYYMFETKFCSKM